MKTRRGKGRKRERSSYEDAPGFVFIYVSSRLSCHMVPVKHKLIPKRERIWLLVVYDPFGSFHMEKKNEMPEFREPRVLFLLF